MICGLNKIIALSGLGYMVSPYTNHPTELDRYCDLAADACARLHEAGLVLIAPIVMGHRMWKTMPDMKYTRSHEMWMPICERLFSRCDYGIVCMLSGWELSKGSALEVFIMSASKKQVLFYEPQEQYIRTLQEMYDIYPIEMGEMMKLAADNVNKVPSLHLRSADQSSTYVQTVLGLSEKRLNG